MFRHYSARITALHQLAYRRDILTYVFFVLISSLVGALVFPLSVYGRTTLAAVSKEWLLLLLGTWFFLLAWALVLALLTRKVLGLSSQRSLRWIALCHVPMLLCTVLVFTLYYSDFFYHTYTNSAYGWFVFQPMAKSYVLLSPVITLVLFWGVHYRQAIVSILPLAIITAASLALRLWNLNWGLPALLHPDEHRYLGPAFLMYATGDLNPHYFENPSIMIYLNFALFSLLSQQAQAFHVLSDFFGQQLLDPRGDYLIVLAARGISAIAGTLTVLTVYKVGRELLGYKAGIFAAGVLAVSLLHVRNSHYTTNDILATFFMALSLLYSSRILAKGKVTDYLLAGLFGGMGVSTKYNVGFFALALVLAHLGHVRKKSKAGLSLGEHRPLAISALVSVAAFFAGTPYAFLDFPSFIADFRNQLGYGGFSWYGQENQIPLLMFFNTLVHSFGLVSMVLAAIGIALVVRRDRWQFSLLISVPAAYVIFMSVQKLFFARFAIPTLPFVALFAGYAIQCLGNLPFHKFRQLGVTALVFSASVIWPLVLSWQHCTLLGQEDTRVLATDWINKHIPPDASLAMEGFAQLDAIFRWRGHQVQNTWVYWPENEQATSRALSGTYEYVVVSSFGYGPWQLKDDSPSILPLRYKLLDEAGQLLALFGAGPSNREIPYAQDDMYTPFWHLMDRERPGPTIRIYRMNRTQ